jgi:hypothetical protein
VQFGIRTVDVRGSSTYDFICHTNYIVIVYSLIITLHFKTFRTYGTTAKSVSHATDQSAMAL